MNPIEKVKSKALTVTPLLLEAKQVNPEVKEYKRKLNNYGINNTTSEKLKEGINKIKDDLEVNLKEQALNILIKMFSPFNIVSYATLDEVCKDHKLVIASITRYKEAIPDENILEMDNFMELLKKLPRDITDKVSVLRNSYFTFDQSNGTSYLNGTDTSEMFKVAAPTNHFQFRKDDERIGNEIGHLNCEKPKFKFTPEFKVPERPILDPIVFMPIRFMSRTFCIVITAWDKVADDSRILSMI